MNFLTKMADKLAKNSDICKDSQVRLNEKLNTVSCIESMITDDFIFIRNELQVGNKSVMEELGQTKDMISSTEKNFYTYESNMNLLKSMVLGKSRILLIQLIITFRAFPTIKLNFFLLKRENCRTA